MAIGPCSGELLSTLSISHLGGLHVGEPFFSAVGALKETEAVEVSKILEAKMLNGLKDV